MGTRLLFAASPLPSLRLQIPPPSTKWPQPSWDRVSMFSSLVLSPEASSWSLPFFPHLWAVVMPRSSWALLGWLLGARPATLGTGTAGSARPRPGPEGSPCPGSGVSLDEYSGVRVVPEDGDVPSVTSSLFGASPLMAVAVHEECCHTRSASQSSRVGESRPFITTVESVYLKSMGLICPREVLEPQHECRVPPDSLLSCGIDRQFRGKHLSSVPTLLPHPGQCPRGDSREFRRGQWPQPCLACPDILLQVSC